MPDPKNNAKATGDTHPPELEDIPPGRPSGIANVPGASGAPDDAHSHDVGQRARTGKPVEQAGYGKDKDAPGAGNADPGKKGTQRP
jgi:hypothetical protein